MDRAQEWREYAVQTWDDDAIDWSVKEAGEYAWAEIVAWASNNDECFLTNKDLRDWAMGTESDMITEEMIEWAYEYAESNGLESDHSL